jgi:hypothetical protein
MRTYTETGSGCSRRHSGPLRGRPRTSGLSRSADFPAHARTGPPVLRNHHGACFPRDSGPVAICVLLVHGLPERRRTILERASPPELPCDSNIAPPRGPDSRCPRVRSRSRAHGRTDSSQPSALLAPGSVRRDRPAVRGLPGQLRWPRADAFSAAEHRTLADTGLSDSRGPPCADCSDVGPIRRGHRGRLSRWTPRPGQVNRPRQDDPASSKSNAPIRDPYRRWPHTLPALKP